MADAEALLPPSLVECGECTHVSESAGLPLMQELRPGPPLEGPAGDTAALVTYTQQGQGRSLRQQGEGRYLQSVRAARKERLDCRRNNNTTIEHVLISTRLLNATCEQCATEFVCEYGRDDVPGASVSGKRDGSARSGVKVLLGGPSQTLWHLKCGRRCKRGVRWMYRGRDQRSTP